MMELRSVEVTKERNILSVLDKDTKKMVYVDLANGVFYGLNKRPVIRVPQMFNKAYSEITNMWQDIPAEDRLIKKLVECVYHIYNIYNIVDFREYITKAIPFCEKVYALGLNINNFRRDNLEELFDTKLSEELVTFLKEKQSGVISTFSVRQYTVNKLYKTTVNDICLRYSGTFARDIKRFLEDFLVSKRYNDTYKKWIIKCLTYGNLGVIPRFTYIIRELYESLEEQQALTINPDHDFFRNYIRICLEKDMLDIKESSEKLSQVNNPKYLCDLSKYGLVMIFPKTKQDFVSEGNNNSNCVASYYEGVVNGLTTIVFIRKLDSVTESYITCEISKNQKRISQFNMHHNISAVTLEREAYDTINSHLAKI